MIADSDSWCEAEPGFRKAEGHRDSDSPWPAAGSPRAAACRCPWPPGRRSVGGSALSGAQRPRLKPRLRHGASRPGGGPP